MKQRTDLWMNDEGARARAVMSGGIHSTQTVVCAMLNIISDVT